MPQKTRIHLTYFVLLLSTVLSAVPTTAYSKPLKHVTQIYAIPAWIKEMPPQWQEWTCMWLNLYYETRGEPKEGMEGAAYVTDYRGKVKRPYLGKTVCENVFLKRRVAKRLPDGSVQYVWHCEYAWVCDKRFTPTLVSMLNHMAEAPDLVPVTTAQLNGTYEPPPALVGAMFYYWPKGSSPGGRAFFKSLPHQIKLGHHWFCGEKKKPPRPQALASN